MRRVTLEFPDCTSLSEFMSKCSPGNRELSSYERLLEGFFFRTGYCARVYRVWSCHLHPGTCGTILMFSLARKIE